MLSSPSVASRYTSAPSHTTAIEATEQQASADQAVSDGVITACIKALLHADAVTRAYEIHVETFQGTVQLSGFVETMEVRTEALALVRVVDGVHEIDDLLDIRVIKVPARS